MKLLLDENLSHRLRASLADAIPDCRHVSDMGLMQASDAQIWEAAKAAGLIIGSKDDDFVQRGLLHGFPPKVVRPPVGNRSTREIEIVLRTHLERIREFAASVSESS